MVYQRILPLEEGFTDGEAISVGSLRDAWVEQRSGLAESGALSAFNDRLVRRWSIETGIVERLYALDRGTTELLINKGLDSSLIEHGASDLPATELIEILRDHQEAAGYVLEHVRQQRGLTAHFVRSVHAVLTRHQDFIEAEDGFGRLFRTELRKGQWKAVAKNPRRPDGLIHEYCPPELVDEEMENLLRVYAEMTRDGVTTVVRAAWLHHRFTQIHPFQDGNGRVARALTAMVFVMDDCFPIVVDRDARSQYIDALEQADGGRLRPLVRLFARLEKQEIEQALSLSESLLGHAAVASDAPLRAKLLAALRDRARDKRMAMTARRREVITKGSQVFRDVIVPSVEQLARDLYAVLVEELPGSDVRMEYGDSSTRHYFKKQLVHIARQEDYFADFDTTHEWVRLRLERPGEGDIKVGEIVVSMHGLGRQFTGVLVVTAYFATRMLDESGRSETLDPHRLAERSLSFSYLEDSQNITARAREWTDAALDVAVEEVRRTI